MCCDFRWLPGGFWVLGGSGSSWVVPSPFGDPLLQWQPSSCTLTALQGLSSHSLAAIHCSNGCLGVHESSISQSVRKMMQNGGVESSGASLWPEFQAPASPPRSFLCSIDWFRDGGGRGGRHEKFVNSWGSAASSKKLQIFCLFNSPGPFLMKIDFRSPKWIFRVFLRQKL